MSNPASIEDNIKNRAFYYISPHNELNLCSSGDVLQPSIAGTVAKAFWIKDSPAQVWLFADVYETREKFTDFLKQAWGRGASRASILSIATQAGGKDLLQEMQEHMI